MKFHPINQKIFRKFKLRALLFTFLVSAFLSACDKKNDAEGTWKYLIHGTDGSYVSLILTLDADGTFQNQSDVFYPATGNTRSLNSGTWKVYKDGTIQLISNTGHTSIWKLTNDNLSLSPIIKNHGTIQTEFTKQE